MAIQSEINKLEKEMNFQMKQRGLPMETYGTDGKLLIIPIKRNFGFCSKALLN